MDFPSEKKSRIQEEIQSQDHDEDYIPPTVTGLRISREDALIKREEQIQAEHEALNAELDDLKKAQKRFQTND